MVSYDERNNKQMGRNMKGYENGGDEFFPKDAKVMKMKCPGAIDEKFEYPDTQQAIYRDQEDQIKDANRAYAKGDKRRH